MTEYVDVIILGLLVATAGLVMLANRLRVPYPVFLLLGGLALGFTPGVPSIELPPDLVLLIFLPPILYAAACLCSPRDLRVNLKPITLLATALVALTTVSVTAVAHLVIGLPWGAAFVLGAVVSPTDPTAATCIAGRLGVSRQIVTIIEGESLVNDAAALLLYHVAWRAVVYGGFSLLGTAGEFVLYGLGGAAIGLAVGWLIARVRRHVKDRLVETTISLFTSYAAYIPAQALGASGVLAAVAAGLYLGWYAPLMTAPRSRLQMSGVWEVLPFLLNSVLFILIGLQLPSILDALPEYSMLRMFLYGALISLVVISTRLLWMFPMAYFHFPGGLNHRLRREHHPAPTWQELAIVGYTGMRGGVSLAAALAIPFTTQGGAAFPGRDLILFLTFCVILFTLVPQGLSLPLLIRRLGLASSEEVEAREETEARLRAAEAALARLDELKDADGLTQDTSACLRDLYEYRRRRFAARGGAEQAKNDAYENEALAFQRFRLELLTAERAALLRLRSEGRISDEVRRRVERELDLEETRLEV